MAEVPNRNIKDYFYRRYQQACGWGIEDLTRRQHLNVFLTQMSTALIASSCLGAEKCAYFVQKIPQYIQRKAQHSINQYNKERFLAIDASKKDELPRDFERRLGIETFDIQGNDQNAHFDNVETWVLA